MNANVLVETQLAHNAWATRAIIDQCRSLEKDQFTSDLGIGVGSLQQTLEHLVEAMFFFADNFHGREYHRRDHFAELARTPDGLRELLTRVEPELASSVRHWLERHGMDDPIPWATSDAPITTATGLAQVFDHGTHHRAQCLYMLKKLGALGDLAVHPLLWSSAQDHASA